jgi:hypothetical protein
VFAAAVVVMITGRGNPGDSPRGQSYEQRHNPREFSHPMVLLTHARLASEHACSGGSR